VTRREVREKKKWLIPEGVGKTKRKWGEKMTGKRNSKEEGRGRKKI
jgi:hypothetical protein